MNERDPMSYFVNRTGAGFPRTDRDRLISDLQGHHERAAHLKRRVAALRHWTLAHSPTAAYDATEHEKELAKVNRKMAKLWKAFDAADAPPGERAND